MPEITVTKARVILKALIAKRNLKSICEFYEVSYKFCHAVSKGEKKPSWDLMQKFRSLFPVDFWFERATSTFIDEIRKSL